MSTIVDEYFDPPVDSEDVFPCKGCGEILEEGKAFELAGNRWHLDCFRCNTCGTLLDSDANLLLLGDGSLICNNCTYSCSACGNKIEDLAILTGDQAFCATCFRCRNCKRKIENLRYARTSQGIFCMGCHETLMARRRKKSKAAATSTTKPSRDKESKEQSPSIKEKSLPALPPNAFSKPRAAEADSDTPTELSPRPRPRPNDSSRDSPGPSRSPDGDSSDKMEGRILPASAYRKNSSPAVTQATQPAGGEASDGFLISVALDPSPDARDIPRAMSDSAGDSFRRKEKDYFNLPKSTASEKRSDSLSSTPHIAFQEKGRQPSHDLDSGLARPSSRKLSKSSEYEPSRASHFGDSFKLQDAPKSKKDLSSRGRSLGSLSIAHDFPSGKLPNGVPRREASASISEWRKPGDAATSLRQSQSQDSRPQEEDPLMESNSKKAPRPDSMRTGARGHLPPAAPRNSMSARSGNQHRQSIPDDSTHGGHHQLPHSRPHFADQRRTSEAYLPSRAAPVPPGGQTHGGGGGKEAAGKDDASASPKSSPKLPRWSSGGDFSMDEDMARILGTDEGSSSILRRVSNVVRHGRTNSIESNYNTPRGNHARSISETTRAMASPRWQKGTTMVDEHGCPREISNPVSLQFSDDPALLRRQLRNSEQRVAELERQFNTEKDLQSLNKKLMEKRKTVSVLGTQTEVMIRQLEVLAGYVERAKETKTAVDPRELEDSAIKEFVQKLDQVKQAMSSGIEQLHHQRDQLLEERNQAMADRDRALMEFEQLSSKNAQLADMNNDLTHQIQERFKSQIGGETRLPGGLGIYSQHKASAGSAINLDSVSMTTGATLVADEEQIVEAGPTVVQVRKGQVRKFNWKKGSKTMAQNVAKGVNRAVVAFQNDRERIQHHGLAGDSIGLPYNMTVSQVETLAPAGPPPAGSQVKPMMDASGRQGFGFFGKKSAMPKSTSVSTVSAPTAAEPPSTLFGSELVERAEYERRPIPTIVSRCIEEVELRGMDQEGIYRKTGGNSQVNMIRDGFDKSDSFDISDPDLDITAVTSVLKQYLRKLPTPLFTFDIYERVLESNAIADEADRCDFLRKTFSSMPQSHRDCLEFLMFHLRRVAQRETENLMPSKNLAVVFAPTVMRDVSIERDMTDMHAKNIAVQFVIENSHRIFADG